MRRFDSSAPEALRDLRYPLLLRAPGFHMGKHFTRVERESELPAALGALPAGELLAIEYLDARGSDGMARKYRVMFIDRQLLPLHLAVSKDWKVHYFSAAMADNAPLREEERRFLEDMPAVLGARAMQALEQVCRELDLDYAGIDFGLAPDGSVLLFEANATMSIITPGPDRIWDYRRAPIKAALQAARELVLRQAARD
jgi:glutathione synthase/RimK-type ligase-like ATP-grasp enzyme